MLLKLGDSNNDVSLLQTKLGIKPDGIFGKNTEATVKNFQEKNKLNPNGIVDDKTWSLLSNIPVNDIIQKINKLSGIIPDSVIVQLPRVIRTFQINNELRLSHFLSQCAHESANFSIVYENLNYNSIGLRRVFKRYFPTKLIADAYSRNPEKIANKVYANRMGNGSINSGDGWRFRGRGYIQLTGKDNYNRFGISIKEDILKNPDLVATQYPLLSAAWFFSINNLNRISDRGSSTDVIQAVTKRVNGGTNGIDDRVRYFRKIYNALT